MIAPRVIIYAVEGTTFVAGAAVLLAQSTDSLSGGAGWVGAGLLGMVLCWLCLIYLPAKDKQIAGLIDKFAGMLEAKDLSLTAMAATKDKSLMDLAAAKDAQIVALLAKKWEIIQALTKDYKDGIKEVSVHYDAEIIRQAGYWQSQMASMTQAVQDLSEHVQERMKP